MSERERFEAWADSNLEYDISAEEGEAAWQAWQAACPDGWQCVPKEPTAEMLDRAWADCGVGGRQDYIESYTAMLSAAPKPGEL